MILASDTVNGATIDPREAAHVGTMAKDWWDPKGSSAPLHKLNPPRLRYIREQVDAHWGGDGSTFTPLAGKTALDVGCGAGLLCEPLARLGATVTGIDAAPENIAVAEIHATQSGLAIDYRAGGVEGLVGQFDLVTSLEVIEHVSDPAGFVRGLARTLAEGTGTIPKGTHDWNKFLTPEELTALLKDAGLRVTDTRGLSFSPATGFTLSDSTSLDYFLTAVKA